MNLDNVLLESLSSHQPLSPSLPEGGLLEERVRVATPESGDAGLLDSYSRAVTAAVERVNPSVVNVEVHQAARQVAGQRQSAAELVEASGVEAARALCLRPMD